MLQLICELVPELMPEYYNNHEPVNIKFDPAGLDVALEKWEMSFLWKRKKPSVTGTVFFGSSHPRRPIHTSLLIQAKPEIIDSQKLSQFVRVFSQTFRPDIGLVHVRPKSEMESGMTFKMSTFVLKESLPDLYWVTVFGNPYVKLFGKERLLSTPTSVVNELDDGLVYIQLTNNLMDIRKTPERVEQAREAAKKHLNSNAFFDSEKSLNHVYNTPSFNIVE